MKVQSAEAVLAYTYAWWLTGDEQAARAAVLAAVDRPEVPGADHDLRVEILLRRVRAAAVSAPTMCPASELALLHDAIGLGLDSAAGLTAIDAREARTELAHGRLEALGPEERFEISHPERLGGLAVGNPADVAAARQNPELARLRELILKGREELVGLYRVEVPADLLEAITDEERPAEDIVVPGTGSEPIGPEWFADLPTGPAAHGVERPSEEDDEAPPDAFDFDRMPTVDPVSGEVSGGDDVRPAPRERPPPPPLEEDDEGEIDLSDQVRSEPPLGVPRGRRRWPLVLGTVVIVAAVLAAVVLGGEDTEGDPSDDDLVATAGPTVTPTVTPTASPTATPTATPTGEPEEQPTPEPTTATFAFDRAGVAVGIGGDPDFDNPAAGPFDPVAITVEYEGAEEGDALLAEWTVDGQPFDVERADLSPLLTTIRFTKQVPEEGWPVGQHTLTFTLERTGEVVGETQFVVVDEPA